MSLPDDPNGTGNDPGPDHDEDPAAPAGSTSAAAGDPMALADRARAQPRSAGRLLRLLRQSLRIAWDAGRGVLVATAALQLITGLVAVAQILVVEQVLSSVIAVGNHHGHIGGTVLPLSVLALIVAVTAVSGACQVQLQRLLAELVARRTWAQILDVTTSVALRRYDASEFYDHLQRVQVNAVSRPFALVQGLVALAGGVASGVGLAVAVIAIQPLLLPLVLIAGVPLWLATRRGGNLEFAFAVAQTPRLRLRMYLQLVLSGRDEAKEIRAFGIGPALRARYDGVYDTYLGDLRHHVRRRAVLAAASGLGAALVLALSMFAVVWMVAHHDLTLAAAGAALVAVRLIGGQVTSVFSSVQQVFESGLFLDDLDRFLEIERVPVEAATGRPAAPATFSKLEAHHLTFTYPGGPAPAVQDVDLELRQGQVVAIVGENGSGKTTLAKLLAGLYGPDTGTIRWDGMDVAGYDGVSLRRRIGVLFQDFARYQLSVRANIGLGRPELNEQDPEIETAAERAGADRFVRRLPGGYDTILSRAFAGGHELSGGQWQRVGLARAFYRDAPFVILDEPSSALDPRAEYELFNTLRRLLAGRTVLYISHRLSTVREADRIYVMDGGRVAES
ncbi:MAG TPA: ABC transporter ATP-binding protein, partial [Acidimicrobiales bacterium]|nr:ABC transporter ATP-binding protein [Acidimicrobiales bacterium]